MAAIPLERLRPVVLPTAFAAALLLLWQALVVIFGYPKVILPAPSDIWVALWDNFGTIWHQTVPTVRDTLAGFVLAAVFGVGLASLQMAWQAARVDIDDPEDCLAKFRSNRLVGWALLLGAIAAHRLASA